MVLGTKKINFTTIKKWLIKVGIVGVPMIIGLFFYLSSIGAITTTGFTYDNICVGTVNQTCNVYLNFTANTNIYIYPDSNWTKTAFPTDPQVQDIQMYYNSNGEWKLINMTVKCQDSLCGKSSKKAVTYSFLFQKGMSYQLKFAVVKQDPTQDINWSIKI